MKGKKSKSEPYTTENSKREDPGAAITQVSQHQVAALVPPSNTSPNLSPFRASDFQALLPPATEQNDSRILLVLDLDETLVHSSFKPVAVPDLVMPVEIKGNVHQVYVKKRPYLEEFMRRVAKLFEVVVFTASLAEYADPLLDKLDPLGDLIHHRLFREHCSHTNGVFVKDLSLLGRVLARIVIVDNSPTSFLFQPRNSIQCTSWFDDTTDTELLDLLPHLEELAQVHAVYGTLDEFRAQVANGKSFGEIRLSGAYRGPPQPLSSPTAVTAPGQGAAASTAPDSSKRSDGEEKAFSSPYDMPSSS